VFPNRIKQIAQEGGTVLNGWLHIPSTWSAEILARQDWDSLVIDMQHGMMGLDSAIPMIQAIQLGGNLPMVRVPWHDPGLMMRLLDVGALGIICPMVNTADQCAAFVGACRYPPLGYRSLGPTRARVAISENYLHEANEQILTFAMIETAQAMRNLEAICATPGLDAIYVGPGDLRLTLFGKGGIDVEEEAFLEVLERIVRVAKQHQLIAGIHTGSAAYAQKMMAMGFQFITLLSDGNLLASASSAILAETRSGKSGPAGKGQIY